jgi:thymidylate synthase
MKYRNMTYAFVDSLRDVLTTGKPLTVRSSNIVELRNRVIVIERPQERCLMIPGRHNNIFATIAETMWVLAGRNDLDFLAHYLPRARDFSDDGQTWRGAYGPRLRHWQGVDQLSENLTLLRHELNSRRAVISLFDPALDFVDSKDIPCNNWIHWLVRDEELYMNIALRSNDIMWGFSGINTFEWSVLHELMANWLHVGVGELTFFASSFHLYEHHKQRAHAIVEQFPGVTCYDYGIDAPRFQTEWDDFDELLRQWFALEARIRISPEALDDAILRFSDPLLRQFLFLIQLYNGAQRGWPIEHIDERLAMLSETDLTVAAYEFFHRKQPLSFEKILQPAIAHYWAHYHGQSPLNTPTDGDILRQAIIQLHRQKTASYGSSWKRRGEQVSILANIARKVDRLELVADGAPQTPDETLFDTAVDLFVYCLKYQTYLADIDNHIAEDLFGPARSLLKFPYSEGCEGFDYIIKQTNLTTIDSGRETMREAVAQVLAGFVELERCFSETGGSLPTATRLERVKRLVNASIQLLGALKMESPALYRHFVSLNLEGTTDASG